MAAIMLHIWKMHRINSKLKLIWYWFVVVLDSTGLILQKMTLNIAAKIGKFTRIATLKLNWMEISFRGTTTTYLAFVPHILISKSILCNWYSTTVYLSVLGPINIRLKSSQIDPV